YPAVRVAIRAVELDVLLNTMAERSRRFKNLFTRQHTAKNSLIFWSEQEQERRIGIFAKGGCDLPSIMSCKPLIEKVLRGTCCIMHEGSLADARTDLLLQTLRTDLPRELIDEVIAKLRLQPECFQPRLFEKTFKTDGPDGSVEFPLSVVILGSG